jgi:hypothetical protein
MNAPLRNLIVGIAALAANSAMANVVFFESDNFQGRQFRLDQSVQNFAGSGFNDRAQSAIVEGDSWEFCINSNYGGGCSVLAPGRYPTLGVLAGRVSSARPVGTAPVASTPAASDIALYDAENFGGRRLTADRPVDNIRTAGLNGPAKSVMVRGGAWEICADDNYRGGCAILDAGSYPMLGLWAGRIGSARPVTPPVASMQQPAFAMPSTGAVTFYENENFGGRQFVTNESMANFAPMHFTDRAKSAIVDGGAWEICVDTDFQGSCRTLVPGRYPTLGDLDSRARSARPSYAQRGEPPRDMTRGHASSTLYSGPNLTGRAFHLGDEGATNLEGAFNDRASSLRVDRGYWIFCSDANFRGECRTFGPGEYAQLPPDFDNRISSGRRISNDYPYADRPAWR